MAAIELNSTPLLVDTTHYYRFESNSNDSKGSDNGTDTSITYNASNGKFNNGAGFGGASKIVYGVKLIPKGAKTISFWIKSTSAGDCVLFDQSDRSSSSNGITIDMGNAGAGKIKFWLFKGTAGTPNFGVASTGTVNDDAFHLVSCVWDGTTDANAVKIFIDNGQDGQGTAAATETNDATNNLTIGSQVNDSQPFTGSLDDVAIFDRALTLTEHQNLYNGTWGGGAFLLNFI